MKKEALLPGAIIIAALILGISNFVGASMDRYESHLTGGGESLAVVVVDKKTAKVKLIVPSDGKMKVVYE